MARFCGLVGYCIPEETRPGVWIDKIVEKTHYGNEERHTFRYQNNANSTNDDLNINNQISIVANEFADVNAPYIKYVVFKGAKWKVTNIDFQRPRIILTLGGLYNGQ